MKFEATVQSVGGSNVQLYVNQGSFQLRVKDVDQARWFGARLNGKVTLTIEDPDA